MSVDAQEAFLQNFERLRREIEERVLRMPESSQVLARSGVEKAQPYLHALPTVMALLSMLSRAPRTAGALADRLRQAGPVTLNPQATPRALMCFGVAYFYRLVNRRTRDPEMANMLARIATLATLGDEGLEQVDWVVGCFTRAKQGGSQDWLAPALLLVTWVTGTESPARARWANAFLEQFYRFLEGALDEALAHRIYMSFPW